MDAPDPEVRHCDRHGSLISTRPLPLGRIGGKTWNPFRKLWFAWRYGWSHPDEDLLGVIDAAGDALRAQIASAKAVLNGEALAEAKRIENELEEELCRDVPGLALLLGLEARINALYPPAIQRRRAWMLRERFERVAPARAVVEYWASNPPMAGGPDVLAEEVRRCETAVLAANASLATARPGANAGAIAEAEARLDRATAERDLARANVEVDRSRRAMAAATEAARAAATGAEDVREAAQAGLEAARRAHGAAMDAFDAAEELLVRRGGALPAIAGSAIDADAQTLLGYIHSSYMMSIGREKATRDLMRWLIMRFWSANVIAVIVLFLVLLMFKMMPNSNVIRLANLVLGLFFIAAVGRIGATMSVVQRLQSAVSANILSGDSFLELTKLRTGKNGINLALFSGAVFALLLYAIFATGAPAMLGFENGIFPQVATRTVATTPDLDDRASSRDVQDEGTKPAEPAGASEGAARTDAGNSAAGTDSGASANASGDTPAGTAAGKAKADGNAAAPGNQAQSAGQGNGAASGNAAGPPIVKKDNTILQMVEVVGGAGRSLWGLIDSAPSNQCKAYEACDPFTQFSEALGFPTRMDFFKLILWAFLAGFAERLVPDVLDSITRRTRNGFTAQEEAAARRRRAAATGAAAPASDAPVPPAGENGQDFNGGQAAETPNATG